MAEFFLELFSEEIPARMQEGAATLLAKLAEDILAPLAPTDIRGFHAARRIAVAATIAGEVPASESEVRGPKLSAPAQALEGFLRKNTAMRDDLIEAEGYFLLRRALPARPAASLIAGEFAAALANFSWPKSMRWGQSDTFTWVRPLRRVVCLLDGKIVPFRLGPVESGNETEGHRFLAPGAFRVTSAPQWQDELRRCRVIVAAEERRKMIADGLREAAAERNLTIVADEGLLDEVSGLVEWPVCLLGAIELGQMALPPEVRELSMKVNQRYFATRDATGKPAAFFAFVANIEANDGGAAIIAGNERVLRARLADAEHFWALDRKQPLDHYLPKLDSVTFHAKLGTQLARASRISALARDIALKLGADEAMAEAAARGGLLCKADLVTGMVGEFPELQGIMGGYYAEASDEGVEIAGAISTHYQPKSENDPLPGAQPVEWTANWYKQPAAVIACAVALADKFDTLREFFRIGEKPTGSGDPYALRRAALGIVRILIGAGYRLNLNDWCSGNSELVEFIVDRLRVRLRKEGRGHDALSAVFAADESFDLVLLILKTDALVAFRAQVDGQNLIAAYRRGVNILRIEDAKDGPHEGKADPALLAEAAEIGLADALDRSDRMIEAMLAREDFTGAMIGLANLREPVDNFFDQVTVNVTGAELRRNRLRLLARLRDVMHRVADFSKLEG